MVRGPAKVANVIQKARKVKKGVKAGEAFVHVAPKVLKKKIAREGLKPSGMKIWFTKLKYIGKKSPSKYENAAKLVKGKLDDGAVKVFLKDKGAKLKYKGMSRRKGGIPQWVKEGSESISPGKIKIERW